MPVYCVSINFVLENELIKYRLTCLFYSLISPKLTLYWWTEQIQYEFKVHHVSEIPHYSPFPIAEQYIKVKKTKTACDMRLLVSENVGAGGGSFLILQSFICKFKKYYVCCKTKLGAGPSLMPCYVPWWLGLIFKKKKKGERGGANRLPRFGRLWNVPSKVAKCFLDILWMSQSNQKYKM